MSLAGNAFTASAFAVSVIASLVAISLPADDEVQGGDSDSEQYEFQ